ncbi:hypothetical protein [Microbacterium sp. NPDC089695]|uniref:hypothetical protein n=1 Tax=Microbacterium sp. NPDC089695 TaxID=3364198 RepID=UPI00381AC9BF
MEILRLAGGPGVGKSAVARRVAQRLRDDGVRAGYVDIDQLGMCYPAPQADPDRWALKERVLERVARGFADAGMQTLVVSGVAETRTPPTHGRPATSIWLDAAESVRRARLAVRDWPDDQTLRALAAGTEESAHAHADWIRIATDHLTVDEVADAVVDVVRCADAPLAEQARPATVVSEAHGSVLWVTGPRLAGASTIGWRWASELWADGVRTGFADAAQLAFTGDSDAPSDALALAGVVALHESFAQVGAEHLVVVAPDSIASDDVTSAFPHAEVVVLRLISDATSRRAHAEERRHGRGPHLAGDDVVGASDAEIEALLAATASSAASAAAPGLVAVDTSGIDVDATVHAVRTALLAHGPADRRPSGS